MDNQDKQEVQNTNGSIEASAIPESAVSVTSAESEASPEPAIETADFKHETLKVRVENSEYYGVKCQTATQAQELAQTPQLNDPALYFNKELSWLDFNWRVYQQIVDKRHPLLERIRFLAIAANNLDEFIRKRVGGLKRQVAAGVRTRTSTPDERTPAEQLALVRNALREMQVALDACWKKCLLSELDTAANIQVLEYCQLNDVQRQEAETYFRNQLFPVLTPLAVDPTHPFPFISNQSLNLAILLRHPKRKTTHFARLKVPNQDGRWIRVSGENSFVSIEQIISHNLDDLFRGMEVVEVHPFRVTRNADISVDEEVAEDLIQVISEELRERRFAPVVGLDVHYKMPAGMVKFLQKELLLDKDDVYLTEGLINLADLFFFTGLDQPDHLYPEWEPLTVRALRREGENEESMDIFSVIRKGDFLVHHPYHSFVTSVQHFVEAAAKDPKVVAIKQTLYRTASDSKIVEALVRAATEYGKQVAVLVEVKARFDEENNIQWAQKLEKYGVHVTYGVAGLKTHTKTTLVIRNEADGLKKYCHIGTGNYNSKTARVYTDLGLFTCDDELGNDLVNLFHYLTGFAPDQNYGRLIIAPRDMRKHFIKLIRKEVEYQRKSQNGRIIAKMNALDDRDIIHELYKASRAGVKIDLIVRGHCRLRPGVAGISENINVISIIGQFLEHSRIYYFGGDEKPEMMIGSADWQRRNLDDRVEAVVPIFDAHLQKKVVRVLKLALSDNRLAWELDKSGHYFARRPAEGQKERNLHKMLKKRTQRKIYKDDAWDINGK